MDLLGTSAAGSVEVSKDHMFMSLFFSSLSENRGKGTLTLDLMGLLSLFGTVFYA